MPKFEPKYSEDDFIKILQSCGLCTTGYITKRVGCARKTSETYLEKMRHDGRISKLFIDEGQSHVWALVE